LIRTYASTTTQRLKAQIHQPERSRAPPSPAISHDDWRRHDRVKAKSGTKSEMER
jgi:hypothetical protein